MAGETLGEVIRRLGRSGGLQGDLAQPDAQLLERFARRRDEPAFAALLARHGPMILGVCRRLLPDGRDAEDAFQATFLILARKAGSIRRGALLGPWLYGVGWRVAVRLRGRAVRRSQRERAGVDLDALPADDAAWSDVRCVVHEEVQRLPDAYRSAVVLCCLEGKSNEEAARLLRRPVGTVKSRLTRARQLLRTRLARRGMAVSVGTLGAILAANAATASAALTDATIRAALPFVASGVVAGGVVSARAVALSRGVLQAMMTKKIALTAAVVLSIVLFGGVGRLACAAWGGRPVELPKAAERPAAADEKPADKLADDKQALQGRWRVVSVDVGGKEVERGAGEEWLVKDGWVIAQYKDSAFFTSAVFAVHPDKSPKEFDINPFLVGARLESDIDKGIYTLDGDVWKVCLPHLPLAPEEAERPKEMATKEGSKAVLITLKRVPPEKEKPKDDREAIQGVWRITNIVARGKEQDDAQARYEKTERYVVTADRIIIRSEIEMNLDQGPRTTLNSEFTYDLDPTQAPKTLDMRPQYNPFKGKVLRGVYSLDGDVLTICQNPGLDGERPKQLVSKEGDANRLLTLKRAMPDDDKDALQGAWRIVGVETEGKEQDDARAKTLKAQKWVFTADALTMGAPERKAAYQLDATKAPKTLDIIPAYPPGEINEGVIPAIYRLDGAVLKICLGPLPSQIKQRDQDAGRKPKPLDLAALLAPLESRRPKDFPTKEGGYSTLLTLEREAADKDDKPKDQRPDKEALQGAWRVESVEVAGKEATGRYAVEKGAEWVVKEKAVEFRPKQADRIGHSTWYRLNADKAPKEIDLIPIIVGAIRPGEDDPTRGVYSLDGDVWKVALPGATDLAEPPAAAKERPKELATREGDFTVLYTLKRVKPGEDKPKDDKPDKEALQGAWQVISIEVGGKEATGGRAEQERKAQWVVKGEHQIGLQSKDPSYVALGEVFTVRPDKNPKEIDINPYPIGVFLETDIDKGIYTLDGDVWKVCLSKWPMDPDDAERPKEMATKDGGKSVLFTLKRVKPDQDKAKDEK